MKLRPSNKHVPAHVVIQPGVIQTLQSGVYKNRKNRTNPQAANDTKAKQQTCTTTHGNTTSSDIQNLHSVVCKNRKKL